MISGYNGWHTSNLACLKMERFAVNYTVSSGSPRPIRLVFTAIHHSAQIIPSSSQLRQEQPMGHVLNEALKKKAGKKISLSMKHWKGLTRLEHSAELTNFPVEGPFLVNRSKRKWWECRFKFIRINQENVVVQMDHVWRLFWSIFVKPDHKSLNRQSTGKSNGNGNNHKAHLAYT